METFNWSATKTSMTKVQWKDQTTLVGRIFFNLFVASRWPGSSARGIGPSKKASCQKSIASHAKRASSSVMDISNKGSTWREILQAEMK